MGKLINKLRFITVDNFEKEEDYFHSMSEKGFHIETYAFPFYKFRQGSPKNYIYQTDFQKLESSEKESYMQLFEDDGWELVFEYPSIHGTWFYFRKPKTNETNDKIFTDASSKIDLYRKIRRNWLVFFLIMTPLILLPSLPVSSWTDYWTWPVIIVWVISASLYAKMAIKLTVKIKQLMRAQTD